MLVSLIFDQRPNELLFIPKKLILFFKKTFSDLLPINSCTLIALRLCDIKKRNKTQNQERVI